MEGGKLFFPTEGKDPHEGPVYCRQHLFSVEVVAVLMLIHPCHALSGVIGNTKKDEDKPDFLFLLEYGMAGSTFNHYPHNH